MKRYLHWWIYEWLGKFKETSLPEKEDLYSQVSIRGFADAIYTHRKRVYKDFEKEVWKDAGIYVFKAKLYYLLMCLRIFEICVF